MYIWDCVDNIWNDENNSNSQSWRGTIKFHQLTDRGLKSKQHITHYRTFWIDTSFVEASIILSSISTMLQVLTYFANKLYMTPKFDVCTDKTIIYYNIYSSIAFAFWMRILSVNATFSTLDMTVSSYLKDLHLECRFRATSDPRIWTEM